MSVDFRRRAKVVSTHSRPKAAGTETPAVRHCIASFNTQPPEGGWDRNTRCTALYSKFQHTAARRRLGKPLFFLRNGQACFNTQPPEGGWDSASSTEK